MEVDRRLEQLWKTTAFTPNEAQRRAILHVDGPLYLPAGPGSGKTRVLLWRTINLIVCHDVDPAQIFLATFTEKAAHQLREGLRGLLSVATELTGRPYDLATAYVGTLHALAQRLLTDRRFVADRARRAPVMLLDDLGQYLFLRKTQTWQQLLRAAGLDEAAHEQLTSYLTGQSSRSRHTAVEAVIALFNRFSEECLTPEMIRGRTAEPRLQQLAAMYERYLQILQPANGRQRTDFALLQRRALDLIEQTPATQHIFRHVIVDEYQDTNTIQERIYFALAAGSRNLCVVGDDDQALYRFRGATVENFVEFPQRCRRYFNCTPQQIALATNYRSRRRIVDIATRFVESVDWHKRDGSGWYRVAEKRIHAQSSDHGPSVVVSRPAEPLQVVAEIAQLVQRLLRERVVDDPQQIAFLYPSLQSVQVKRMREALEAVGLKVYAPRAGTFLDVEEAHAVFGVMLQIFGRPPRGDFGGKDNHKFNTWLDTCETFAADLLQADSALVRFVAAQQDELQRVQQDYRRLIEQVVQQHWELTGPINEQIVRVLQQTPLLSTTARRILLSPYLQRTLRERAADGQPFSISMVINRATALDWNVQDLFYRLCSFDHFKRWFDLAQTGDDEGPLTNLSLITEYLDRFSDEYVPVLTAERLHDGGFSRIFFFSYLYALHRRGEREYEDADDPFPRGRIPFLTIHQAKGLEFPVVVLGNLLKRDTGPQRNETIVRPLLTRDGEPLDRLAKFDIMRMYYVALSRAQNLLILAHYSGPGQSINREFEQLINDAQIPLISALNLQTLPRADATVRTVPYTYSFNADYLQYRTCPRQYMIFQHYGFVPARTQTMLFGSLVHRTLEDLHHSLIAERKRT